MTPTTNERRSGGAFHLLAESSAAARAAGPRGVALFDLFAADARGRGYSTLANDVLCAELRCSDDTVTRGIAALACAGLLSVRYARLTGKLRRRVVFVAEIADTADGPHFVESSILADPDTEIIVEAEAKPRTAGGAPRRFSRPFKVGDLASVPSMRHQVRPVSQYPARVRHIESSIPRTGAASTRARAPISEDSRREGRPADARASAPLSSDIDPEPLDPMGWTLPTCYFGDDDSEAMPTGTLGGPSAEIVPNGTVLNPAPTAAPTTATAAAPVPIVDTAPAPTSGTRHEAAVEAPKAKSRPTSRVTAPTAPRTIAAAWYAAVSRFTERTGRKIARHDDDRNDLSNLKKFAGGAEDVATWAAAFDLALSSPEFWANLDARTKPISPLKKIMFDRDDIFHRAANVIRERRRSEQEIEATRERIEREKREEIEARRAAPIDRAAQIAKRKAEVLASLAGAAQ